MWGFFEGDLLLLRGKANKNGRNGNKSATYCQVLQVKTGSLITGDCSQFGGTRSHSFLLLLLWHVDTMLHKFPTASLLYRVSVTLSCANAYPIISLVSFSFILQFSRGKEASTLAPLATPRFLIIQQQQQQQQLSPFVPPYQLCLSSLELFSENVSVARLFGAILLIYMYMRNFVYTADPFFEGRGSKLKEQRVK